ncbi:hypothetical protein HMPREF0970_00619 [Schaalia odontolytica F0309]|uniref:Uncharacterized protein n=1 Tax=Schaalia odontolytica F0309 TaxID=649742 RepID=D4TXF6_9ACTO|nr:hypothetical protein HMPREF0970_00619 [Schaalia odontolytica F0309]
MGEPRPRRLTRGRGFIMRVMGELHCMRVRHAGDALSEGFVSCKTPTVPVGWGRTSSRASAKWIGNDDLDRILRSG